MNAESVGKSPWWKPHRHEDRRPFLLRRNAIVRAFRHHFEEADFIEVDPAALQHSPGNETHLHSFRTEIVGNDLSRRELHLHTSPEFACKKLLAAGEGKIVCFAHVWRNRERGPLHHPEFTMLEWYRAGGDLETLMEDCTILMRLAATIGGTKIFEWQGMSCDPFLAPERISVAEAFARHADIDLLSTLTRQGEGVRDALATQVSAIGMRVDPDDSWSDLFSKVMVEKIDPRLGIGQPTFLTDYPAPEAALARRSRQDARVSERFELFAATVELANAFGELTDPVEQRARFEADMIKKRAIYGEDVPIDEDLLEAIGLMPETCGIALGLDRLIMLATGARHIETVLWAPVPE